MLEPFDEAMIVRYLESEDIAYYRNDRGDYLALFDGETNESPAVRIHFCLEGAMKDMYRIWGEPERRVASSDWPVMLSILNRYQRQFRWPKVHLRMPDESEALEAGDATARVITEVETRWPEGATQEQIEAVSREALTSVFHFVRWLEQYRPPSPLHDAMGSQMTFDWEGSD